MRGAFVAQKDLPAQIILAFGLAFDQQLHPAGQNGDFAFLTGDDFGEFINRTIEMGKGFFDRAHTFTITKLFTTGQLAPQVT